MLIVNRLMILMTRIIYIVCITDFKQRKHNDGSEVAIVDWPARTLPVLCILSSDLTSRMWTYPTPTPVLGDAIRGKPVLREMRINNFHIGLRT